MKKFIHDKNAVSVIIGTILLLAITIVIFSGLMSYFLSIPSPNAQPNADLAGFMEEGSFIGLIEHRGGESWAIDDSTVVMILGEIKEIRIDFANGKPINKSISLMETNLNNRWDVGEILEINCSSLFGQTYHLSYWQIEAMIVHNPSKSIIMDTILQPGILNFLPPIVQFSYNPNNPKVDEMVYFDGSESFDPDGGEIVYYNWDFGDDQSGTGMMPTNIYANPGIYTINLTITDDEGQQTTSTIDILTTLNMPPVAFFTNTSEGNGWIYFDSWTTNNSQYYDDQHSYDPDGNIAYWTWDFGNGEIIENNTNPTILYQYNGSGQYTVKLVVTDDEIRNPLTASYTQQINISNFPPVPLFTHTPNPTIHMYIFFNASDSYDRDGYITNYSWDFNNDGITDAYGIAPTVKSDFSTSGFYDVNLTVTDDQGLSNFTIKTIYVDDPVPSQKILLVDNTPANRGFDGIENIIKDLNLGYYEWGKVIDQNTFYEGSPNVTGKAITAEFLTTYDVVIWSTGDFPGDNTSVGNNYWETPLTNGGNDGSNHIQTLYNYLTDNKEPGALLLCGTYAARDLQGYWGNEVTIDEVKLGQILGLEYDNKYKGGLNETTHVGQIAYFTDGTTFGYGPVYQNGTIEGVQGTSSRGNGELADIYISEDMGLYNLVKDEDSIFNYSLIQSAEWINTLDDFEGEKPFGEWNISDADNDNETWRITNDEGYLYAHSGEYYAECFDGDDDWLIMPKVSVPPNGELRFWARSRSIPPKAKFEVWLSTTGNSISDFLNGEFIGEVMAVDVDYLQHSYDISRWSREEVFLAIRSVKPPSNDRVCLLVDDVEITWSTVPQGAYAIDADREGSPSILCGFNLNSPFLTSKTRKSYLRSSLNWLYVKHGCISVVYVDNDRPLDWYDETHKSTIQKAVDTVCIGGYVYILNGTGYGSAVISKSLSVIGLNNSTIFDGEDYGLKVIVDLVVIENLSIRGENKLQHGILIDGCSFNSIYNCMIVDAYTGISLHEASSNEVMGNNIQAVAECLSLYHGGNNIITENCISSGDYGVFLDFSDSNILVNNKITGHEYCGIYVLSGRDNIIRNNSVDDNIGPGLYCNNAKNGNSIRQNVFYNNSIGVLLVNSERCNIIENNVISNIQCGIFLESDSVHNDLYKNVISDNTGYGIFLENSSYNSIYENDIVGNYGGFFCSESDYLNILYNSINQSTVEGIHIFSSNSNFVYENCIWNNSRGIHLEDSRRNNILNNTISFNHQSGIFLFKSSEVSSGRNEIKGNIIFSNGEHGISLSLSVLNTITNNVITNNTYDGILLIDKSDSNTVTKNIFINNSCGLHIDNSNGNTVYDNSFCSNINDGISLEEYSSSNTLSNNSISNNTLGIRFHLAHSNNLVNNSISFSNTYGILFELSGSNNIQKCVISNNSNGGLYLFKAHENLLQSCSIFNCGDNGISLVSSIDNEIISNDVYNNANHGLYLERSSQNQYANNLISTNSLYNNQGNGIDFARSNGNYISTNNIWENDQGISFYRSDENQINSNNIYLNIDTGIILQKNSADNAVTNNTLWGNGKGIINEDSDRTVLRDNYLYWHNISAAIQINNSLLGSSYPISHNLIENNSIGIEIISSDGIHIFHNTIHNNNQGISIILSNYVFIQHSNIITSNINEGIYQINSNNGLIDGNIISDNAYGVRLNSSDYNTIHYNNIFNNPYGVQIEYSSNNNIIKENNISINTPSQYVVFIIGSTNDNNYIFWNNFENTSYINQSLGHDEGGNGNCWYNPSSEDKKGNYWENYLERYPYSSPLPGGWWDTYYEIGGTTGRKDIRPLVEKYVWWSG